MLRLVGPADQAEDESKATALLTEAMDVAQGGRVLGGAILLMTPQGAWTISWLEGGTNAAALVGEVALLQQRLISDLDRVFDPGPPGEDK